MREKDEEKLKQLEGVQSASLWQLLNNTLAWYETLNHPVDLVTTIRRDVQTGNTHILDNDNTTAQPPVKNVSNLKYFTLKRF